MVMSLLNTCHIIYQETGKVIEKIEPDWLLIYAVESDELATFYRTGTHSDLF